MHRVQNSPVSEPKYVKNQLDLSCQVCLGFLIMPDDQRSKDDKWSLLYRL